MSPTPANPALEPGTIMSYGDSHSSSFVVLSHRKATDDGWWNTDGSGLADFAIAKDARWQVVARLTEMSDDVLRWLGSHVEPEQLGFEQTTLGTYGGMPFYLAPRRGEEP